MPRESWRDDPEPLALWRSAREEPDDTTVRLALADWLEERGHAEASWRERLHGIIGSEPKFFADTGVLWTGHVPMGKNAWRRVLAAPPPGDLLCVFDRDMRAYQYLRQFRGRCGLNLSYCNWTSTTERDHILAVPRLEMLAVNLLPVEGWDWVVRRLPGLTQLEVHGSKIDPPRLADLKRFPRLRDLALRGAFIQDTSAIDALPGLRYLSLRPLTFSARRLAALAPNVEFLQAAPLELGSQILWPRLRTLRMLGPAHSSRLETRDLRMLARHENLERLDLHCGRLTAAAFAALAELPRLRELSLEFAEGDLASLKALAKAPALESLKLVNIAADDARLAEISNMTRLRFLSIGRASIEKITEDSGDTAHTLNQALVGRSSVGGKGLAGLTGLTRLEELVLHGECADDSALPALAALPRLQKLDLKYLKIPPETARAVREACPPWVDCTVPE